MNQVLSTHKVDLSNSQLKLVITLNCLQTMDPLIQEVDSVFLLNCLMED